MTDLVSLLDLADLAVGRCEGAVPPESRRELAGVVRRSRRKLGYVGEVLVVAFAGGTGSGKSAIINAIVGELVARTGVVRPTTNESVAVTPPGSSATYSRLLADLDVTNRVESSALKSTVLVDLPDFDSRTAEHRHIVESVLPVVDAVVWLFDPEKYADRVVHTEFLANLVPYQNQFVFVLNQTDRLGDSATLVADDLTRLLVSDGFVDPEVVQTVARGPEIDVSNLISTLYRRLDRKRTVISKIVTDLRVAANDGWMTVNAEIPSDADDELRDTIGLSAATFVLLGVEAIEMLHQVEEE